MLKPVAELYDGMTIDGNLDLTGRRDIIRLPALIIKGYLSCSACINLQEINPGLQVDDYLSLRGCKSLKAMVPVNVKGKVYIDPVLIDRTPLEILPMLLGMSFSEHISKVIEKRLRGE